MTQLEIMDTIRREIREKGISQAEFSKMLGYGPQKFETDYYRVKHGHAICKSSLEMYLGFIGFKLSIERKETPDIVRCKDCKNWIAGYITDQDEFIPSKCGKYQQMVGHSSDNFCSLAERQDD